MYLAYPDVPLSPDEREYAALGERLAAGGDLRLPTGEVAKRMPLYPVFIAAIRGLGGPDHWRNAVLAYQILLALCGTILLALIAERVGGRRAGWIAGTVAALYSPYRFLQAMLLTETLVIFLLYIAVLLYIAICLQARSPAGRGIAIIGVSVLIGLATLARANALLFLVPFAADTGFRAGSAARRVVRVTGILAPALACAFLWGVRNQQMLGAFTLSTSGGLNFYLGHNEQFAAHPGMGGGTDYAAFDRLRAGGLGEVEADRRLYRQGIEFIAAHPWRTLTNSTHKFLIWLRSTVAMSAPTLPLLAVGLMAFHGWRLRRAGPLTGRRRLVCRIAWAAAALGLVYWVFMLRETSQPWTNPLYVVPLGLMAVALLRSRPSVRGLFLGLYASQMAVAIVFIPLTRLRWVVDGLLIVAIGVGLSSIIQWMRNEREPGLAGPGRLRATPPS